MYNKKINKIIKKIAESKVLYADLCVKCDLGCCAGHGLLIFFFFLNKYLKKFAYMRQTKCGILKFFFFYLFSQVNVYL